MREIYIEVLGGNGWDEDDIFPLKGFIEAYYPGTYVDVTYREHECGYPPEPAIVQSVEPGEDGWIDSGEVDELVQRFFEYEKE